MANPTLLSVAWRCILPLIELPELRIWQNEGDWETSLEIQIPEQVQVVLRKIATAGEKWYDFACEWI